jgi:hypothetical protein
MSTLLAPDPTIELGPDLPMAAFTSTEVWHPERIGALAVYCSDGRWGEAFDDFCHKHLLIPRYDRWAVPGGPACLVPREKSAEFCKATWEQLEFLMHIHELERIVLITHYGCAFYGELLHHEPNACLPTQLKDLRTAAEALREWFPSLGVETYLAMRKGNCLSFHQISG